MANNIIQNLLNISSILDIETTGLERGAGIHQMGLYNVGQQELFQYYINPNLQVVNPATSQDVTRLASSPLDIHSAHPELEALRKRGKLTWRDVITAQTLLNQNSRERMAERMGVKPGSLNVSNVKWAKVLDELKNSQPFLHGTLTSGDFHYFSGKEAPTDERLLQALRSKGGKVQRLKSFTASMDEVLAHDSHFIRQLKGKAIWIANVDFESKMLGAQVAAQEAAVKEMAKTESWSSKKLHDELKRVSGLRGVVSGTSKTVPDALTTTGAAFNQVRTRARMTGDWSPVFRSILETTGAGDVRDIIDVVRAQQSFSQKLKILEGTHPANLSMDVQARLYAYSAATDKKGEMAALNMIESHIAIDDVVHTESPILKEALHQTYALEQVHKGTAEGKAFLEEAKHKKGALWRAIKKAAVEKEFATELGEKGFGQRLARMYQDFAKDGKTVQLKGYLPKQRQQWMPDGSTISVTTPKAERQTFHDVDDAIRHISRDPTYRGVDTKKIIDETHARFQSAGVDAVHEVQGKIRIKSKERLDYAAGMLYEEQRRRTNKIFEKAASPNNGLLDRLSRDLRTEKSMSSRFSPAISDAMKIKGAKYFGMFAAGMTAAGAFKAVADGPRRQREGPESLRTMNYAKWLEMQSQYSGIDNSHMQRSKERPNVWEITGLSKGGMGHAFRSQVTDFGSPYMGPVYSGGVFQQLDLLDQREQYLRSAFGATHMDPAAGVGKILHNNIYNKGGDPYTHPLHWAQDVLLGSKASGINHSFIPGSSLEAVNGAQFAGLRANNFLQLDLSSGNWKVDVQDADTIVVKRGGVTGAIQTFFGANKGYSFRLSGIDSPETAHAGGSGYHRAQPYANAATEAAKQMIHNARNLKLVIDPSNITYGRMVGTVFADNKNLNLEFIKRGMASYLPFKKKGTQEMYEASSYEAASKMAMSSDRGMWREPFFQVYRDIVQQTGQTVTFNTMTQIDKLASSSSLMSLSSLMHNAQNQGFHGAASQIETADLAGRIGAMGRKVNGRRMYMGTAEYTSDAWRDIHTFQAPVAPHKSYMSQMVGDLSKMIRTQGKSESNSLGVGRIGRLDKTLAIDSTQAGMIDNKRKSHLQKITGQISQGQRELSRTQQVARQMRSDQRREAMAIMQRQQNHVMFQKPTNHHRM